MKLTMDQELRLVRARASLAAVSQLAAAGRDDAVEVSIRRDDLAFLLDLIAAEFSAAVDPAA